MERVEIVAYDSVWPDVYAAEHARLVAALGSRVVLLEHIGSTAVPGLAAKPIIDMMGALPDISVGASLLAPLDALGYRLVETGMRDRLFLQNYDGSGRNRFHLHLVALPTWDERKERLMRDYLRAHPDDARAYGELKERLAATYRQDMLAYTRAKTDFIQVLMDRARAERGLPPADVWED